MCFKLFICYAVVAFNHLQKNYQKQFGLCITSMTKKQLHKKLTIF